MREFTLVFTLFLLIHLCIVSYYEIGALHVVSFVISGIVIFGLLKAYDAILTKMEAENDLHL